MHDTIPGFDKPWSSLEEFYEGRWHREIYADKVLRYRAGDIRPLGVHEGAGSCTAPVFSPHPGIWVRCRHCDRCAAAKRYLWFRRTLTEVRTWPRSWFLTLTFRSIPTEPYREVQLWLKRLRKVVSALKYICAQEFGTQKGRIHYHLIVCCEQTVTRRVLEGPWEQGFSKAKLVRTGHVRYVVKYVGKSLERVRASSHFGRGYENVPF